MAQRRLDQEAVQDRAVVAVIVEAVDQPRIQPGLGGLGAPDDALVQVGDPQAVVLDVELEQQLILGLGHVVDRPRIAGVQDLLARRALGCVERDLQIAFRDGRAGGAVAVDAHGAQVRQVDVAPALHDRRQHVVGGVDVVVDGVALVARRLHRIGRGPLFGEVDHRVRGPGLEQLHQGFEVAAQRQVEMVDAPARDVGPGRQPQGQRQDRGQGLDAQLLVDAAARQVVDDPDLMSAGG